MPKGKYWCFTDFDVESHPPYDITEIVYITYQGEASPTTNRQHWQGFVELRKAACKREVQSVLGRQCHVELARASADQCIAYCHKEETRVSGPFEWGERGRQRPGRRTDLAAIAERCKHRGGVAAICAEAPEFYVKYHRGLERLRTHYIGSRDPNDAPDVRLYTGHSGSGKTRSVYSEFSIDEIYQKDGTKWWDGYDGQKCILLDDWAGSDEVPPVELLKILDRYPHRVQTKGGYVLLGRSILIITSMIHYGQWYKGSQQWLEQVIPFERRLTSIKDFGIAGQAAPIGDMPHEVELVV